MEKIRIGTRKSLLALAQTQLVVDELNKNFPDLEIEIITKVTKGDAIQDKALKEFGGKGVFVDELEEAIISGELDFAVHSAKDMPMDFKEGCILCGCLKREDARDVLVTRKGVQYRKSDQFRIGTGSLRRSIQLNSFFPKAQIVEIRGNVPTRLEKLNKGEYDAVVLAAAGLKRLGIYQKEEYNFQFFSCDSFVPAGGQGIIAIEGRKGASQNDYIKAITHEKSMICLEAEREVLKILEAGCHEPIGVYGLLIGTTMSLRMMCAYNSRVNISSVSGKLFEGKELARKLVIG
ncbi:MAG: hydroxymethylbilane synthase [Lachnospiraceae bacterium]|nr:hydroxymethylbilane synthase [Lachnospiraceae bacterium]